MGLIDDQFEGIIQQTPCATRQFTAQVKNKIKKYITPLGTYINKVVGKGYLCHTCNSFALQELLQYLHI